MSGYDVSRPAEPWHSLIQQHDDRGQHPERQRKKHNPAVVVQLAGQEGRVDVHRKQR